ncbi:SnoaL-like domain protein [compost metagenome]
MFAPSTMHSINPEGTTVLSSFKNRVFTACLVLAVAVPTAFAQPASRDFAAEEANRQLVVDFYNRFFNDHDISAANVVAEDYIQHNPRLTNGKKTLVSFFTGFFKENPMWHERIVRSGTDGDLVYLHVHATNGPADRGQAIVDIFRVKDGKIVEHWDVIQPVPESAANQNTMF